MDIVHNICVMSQACRECVGFCVLLYGTVHVFRPDHSQHSEQWIWSGPRMEIRIVRCVCVGYNRVLHYVTLPPSYSVDATTAPLLSAILLTCNPEAMSRSMACKCFVW
jgi:hypothetical protein